MQLFFVALLVIAVGAMWLKETDRIVDGLRTTGKLKASNPRSRQITGAKAYAMGCLALGALILLLLILGIA